MKVVLSVCMVMFFALPRCPLAHGARVLAVVPVFAKSHHMLSQSILKALARAGHEVVSYSPFPLDNPVPNYTDVFLENVPTENENLTQAFLTSMESPAWKCMDLISNFVGHMLDEFVESDKIQKLLSSKEHFDIIFTEFFAGQEFVLLLGHIFKAPVITFQAYATNSLVNGVFGNTLSLPYIPDVCTSYSNKMTFFERALNSVYKLRGLYYVYYQKYLPNLEYRFRRYFPDSPPLLDMVNNISLIFVNDHLTADYAHPRTPNIIPVGGIHIENNKPLPEPIKNFMDEAKEGVIFFSLGTYVPDNLQPQEYFNMYNKVFSQLKQRVLWKTKKENIQGLPDNVMTVKWAPQQDVLAHPNCVLFITHGGILSQHEAIYYEVPVVAIPYLWDQRRNARFYEEQGIGDWLSPYNLSENDIISAIQKVLNNYKVYKGNIKRLSNVFKDRPMTPAQTVVYWTEYVVRHGGAHLRPASSQLSWYQLALLDVLGAICLVIALLIVVTYIIFRVILKLVYNKYKCFEQINKTKCN